MKFNLTGILFILMLSANAFGQNKVTEKKYQTYDVNAGEWKIQHLEQTAYDEAGREILWNFFYRFDEGDSLLNAQRVENIYLDNTHQKIWYKRELGKDEMTPLSINTWEYNQDGCPITCISRALEGSAVSNDNLKKLVYQYKLGAPPCTVEQEIHFRYNPELHDNFINHIRSDYSYENDFKTVIKESYIWIEAIQFWNPVSVQQTEYDENGKKIVQKNVSTNGLSSDFRWEYDAVGRVLRVKQKQYEDGILVEKSMRTFEYEYEVDENGFVIKKIANNSSNSSTRNFFYENYCDGLARIEKEFDDNLLSFKETHFKYLHGTDCEEPKEDLQLTIFPNPTNGQITIESNLLGTNSAEIQIIDLTGRVLQVIAVPERAISFEMQVNDLPFGNYFIRITSDKNSITEQLTVTSF